MSLVHLTSRLSLFLAALTVCGAARGEQSLDRSLAQVDADSTAWYDLENFQFEGKGWQDTERFYDRLPAKAQGVVRDVVWTLGQNSAGIAARFITDAPKIRVRWTLTGKELAMPHMPATGMSGLDLWVKLDNGKWRWLAVAQPTAQSNNVNLVEAPTAKREYRLYLPLYNGVSSVEIGVPKDSLMGKPDRRPQEEKPIVFYGTSITQGASASRPGMCHVAILGRRLNRGVINLGFSGNGLMEPELADLLAELDPAVYVLDCLPNIFAKDIAERTEPFVRKLRAAHPQTPIVLVEDRTYASAFLNAGQQKRNTESRAALKKEYDRLVSAGVVNLHYLPGDNLLSADGDDTVDSSHPSDLGFVHQADAFEKILKPLLAGAAAK